MKTMKLALDWTPNINHLGFFVADALGYFKEAGLEVELLDPQEDNYAVTPAKKVEMGIADMALCPLESVISYRCKRHPFDAVALATLFQEDLSAIVVLEDSDVQRPRDLDGRSYASYKARYEDEIVCQMIKNDGGAGQMELVYPDKLGIWETLQSRQYDATWVFLNWEGVQARGNGLELREFRLSDYDIPYGYSPIILASQKRVEKDNPSYSAFLQAVKKGFSYAKQNPGEAVRILAPLVAEQDKDIDLLKSQKMTIAAYGNHADWGKMDRHRVDQFLNWLKTKDLEKAPLHYGELVYTGLHF
ncbi:ABC transporter substrate-binding protein [Flavobacteriaceae bacterium GF1]